MSKYTVNKQFDISIKKSVKKAHIGKSEIIPLAKYLNIGYYLVTPLIIGVFLGLYIDNKLKTEHFFVLSGIMLGFISAIYNLYKLTK